VDLNTPGGNTSCGETQGHSLGPREIEWWNQTVIKWSSKAEFNLISALFHAQGLIAELRMVYEVL